jgi:hypothetical protein
LQPNFATSVGQGREAIGVGGAPVWAPSDVSVVNMM